MAQVTSVRIFPSLVPDAQDRRQGCLTLPNGVRCRARDSRLRVARKTAPNVAFRYVPGVRGGGGGRGAGLVGGLAAGAILEIAPCRVWSAVETRAWDSNVGAKLSVVFYADCQSL